MLCIDVLSVFIEGQPFRVLPHDTAVPLGRCINRHTDAPFVAGFYLFKQKISVFQIRMDQLRESF